MILLKRQHLSIGWFRNVFSQPFGLKTIPDAYSQTVYILHWRKRALMVNVQDTCLLARIFHPAMEEAAYARVQTHLDMEWYNYSPRTQRRLERRAYWAAFVQVLWQSAILPLVCRLRDHQWQSIADAENGSEDVWCDRCGWSHHAQF
jgi:hypothetical protein